jgi:hypothetical protein
MSTLFRSNGFVDGYAAKRSSRVIELQGETEKAANSGFFGFWVGPRARARFEDLEGNGDGSESEGIRRDSLLLTSICLWILHFF